MMNRRPRPPDPTLDAALFGIGSLLYGLAKIDQAEQPRQLPVEVELPNAVALTAPDMSTRRLGYRACELGVVSLFAAGTLFAVKPTRLGQRAC
jgi:hypothetical protein